jgi:hypothetical protein
MGVTISRRPVGATVKKNMTAAARVPDSTRADASDYGSDSSSWPPVGQSALPVSKVLLDESPIAAHFVPTYSRLRLGADCDK